MGMKAGMFCSFSGISLYEGSLAVGGTLSRFRLRRSLFACLSLSVRFLLRFFPETSTSGASMSLPVERNLMKGAEEVGPNSVGRSQRVGRIAGGRALVLKGNLHFCPGMSGVSTSDSSSNTGIGPNSAGGTESKSARDSTDALGCSGTGKGNVLVGGKNGDDSKLSVATEGEGGMLMDTEVDDANDDVSVFGEGICEGQIVMRSLHLAQYASSLNIASPSAVDMERDVTNPPARGANWESSRV